MMHIEALAQQVLEIFITEAVAVGRLRRTPALERAFSYKIDGESLEIFVADYLRYVEAGRPPGARKVPIAALLACAKRYRLSLRPGQTRQSLAFALQTAIFKRGLRPRPFLQSAGAKAERAANIWLDHAAAEALGE